MKLITDILVRCLKNGFIPAAKRSPAVLTAIACCVAIIMTSVESRATLSILDMTRKEQSELKKYGISINVTTNDEHTYKVELKVLDKDKMIERGSFDLIVPVGDSHFSTSWKISPEKPINVEFHIDKKSIEECTLFLLIAENGRSHLELYDMAFSIKLSSFVQ